MVPHRTTYFYRLKINFLAFLLVAITPVYGQYANGIKAVVGTSMGLYEQDVAIKSGAFLPTFGASYSYQFPMSRQLYFRPSIGYLNRGMAFKMEGNNTGGTDLGSVKSRTRDHFVSNDLIIHFEPIKYIEAGTPFLDLGIRNDFYAFSTYKEKGEGYYFDGETAQKGTFRSRNMRPYVAGVVAAFGLVRNDWEIGLEYYHQMIGSFNLPQEGHANYTQLKTQSLQLSISFRY